MKYNFDHPSDNEKIEAKKFPNGWVYRIHPYFESDKHVPSWAILGAWKVNSEGEIIDQFLINPNFDEDLCIRSTL